MEPPHTPDERRAKLEAVKELARRQEHDAAQELLQAQDVGYTSKHSFLTARQKTTSAL